MEFTHSRTVKIIAGLLLLAALSQPLYTLLYSVAPAADRKFIWAIEAMIFILVAAFSGSALVQAKNLTLGFSAIAFSAIVNVVQVGIGLTQFGPFRAAAQSNPELVGLASSVVGYSFFGYNAAKVLLAMAAVVFGLSLINKNATALTKTIGTSAVLIGGVAFVSNALVMTLGIQGVVPRPLAGGSGVLATLLLAMCLFSINVED